MCIVRPRMKSVREQNYSQQMRSDNRYNKKKYAYWEVDYLQHKTTYKSCKQENA